MDQIFGWNGFSFSVRGFPQERKVFWMYWVFLGVKFVMELEWVSFEKEIGWNGFFPQDAVKLALGQSTKQRIFYSQFYFVLEPLFYVDFIHRIFVHFLSFFSHY